MPDNEEAQARVPPHHHDDKPLEGLKKAPKSGDTPGEGYWGDSCAGGPVNPEEARHDFDELQQELTRRSTTQSAGRRKKSKRRPGIVHKLHTRSSKSDETDVEKANDGDPIEKADTSNPLDRDDFQLEQFMRDGHLEKRHPVSGESTKKVGVVFKGLTVKGVGSSASTVRTLPQAIAGTFGPDLYGIISGLIPGLQSSKNVSSREIIRNFTGVVRSGEMMLVLGRPGSGCSTFLKVIANNRRSFQSVEGDVFYGGISAPEMDKRFRGEVVYNAEDDRHLPNLSVGQTLDFSLRTKTKKHERGNIDLIIDSFLKMFAMSHVRNTPVGDEYVRGVSGGERKRVSIAETLATKSTVTCWDNSTRGLDASTAFNYAKSLRIMTDVSDRTTLTTLYQAGEGIYDLMDKVLVIDEGRMLYQGPVAEARQYFIDLGFYCPTRQTTADFLTSVCDVNVRQFREGFQDSCPKTPEELEQRFRQSQAYRKVLADVEDYEQHINQTEHVDAHTFQKSVRESKSRTVIKGSSYTVSFWKQILACTRREFWLLWGDKTSLYTKFFIIISNGLIVGSLFFNTPSNTQGAFLRGGVAFFSILFLGWLQLSELAKAVSGRSVILRQKEYAFYRPSAVNLARVLADFPLLLVEVIIFGIIMYFMTNLEVEAGKFFIYLLFVYVSTICITALYRLFASLSPSMDDAVRFAGIALNLLIIFTGYTISKPTLLGQKIWFGWIYYINPVRAVTRRFCDI